MIFKKILSGNQMSNKRWSCSTESVVIQLPTSEQVRDVCLCDYSNTKCDYYELAFTSFETSGDIANEYENDYRKFLINPLSLNSLFSFILIDSSNVEYIIYSNADESELYGDVSEQGFNTSQPFQVGIKIDWWKVADVIGYGDYTVKRSQTDFGTETSKTSHVFRVVKFDTQRANGTIKIEVDNVGVTMNGSNWTGLYSDDEPYTNMIRVRGRVMLVDPEIDGESIEDGHREDIPVQTKVTDIYSIAIERLTFGLGYALIHEDIVMNWKITDYNIFNEDFRNKEIIVQSSSVTNTPDYNRKTYELTAKNNISKLNRKFV